MGRRRNKYPFIEDLEIFDVGAEGKSVGKHEEKIVFVSGMIPGDVADVQIKKKKKNYLEGYVKTLKKKSPDRVEPFCSHFGICGGCKWQALPYEKQLFYNQKQVVDNLERIGKVGLPAINPIIASDDTKNYRNKLEFAFADSRWLTDEDINSGDELEKKGLGFHVQGRFDKIVDIEHCYLQDNLSNKIRNAIREFTIKEGYPFYHQRKYEGLMRNVVIRNTSLGEWMIIVVFQEYDEPYVTNLMSFIKDEFPTINSLQYVINPKMNDTIHDLDIQLYSGRDHIFEELDGLIFKIGPKSFFQTNSSQAAKMYSLVLDLAQLEGNELVYDLYTGTGTIANYLAPHCLTVVGLEYVKEAIDDAFENSKLNSIDNTRFFAGDIQVVFNHDFINTHGKPDVIVTDPPRAGMHKDVVARILEASPQKIVYVSCNPSTQARDIQLLSEKYKVEVVQPLDMFPHTHHVENVVLLALK